MTYHGNNVPRILHGSSIAAARRAGQLQAEDQFNERMRALASQGVMHAQEYIEREKAKLPRLSELRLMKNDPGAFNPEYIERWKSLLDKYPESFGLPAVQHLETIRLLRAEGYTLEEIGEELGINRESVRQLL